MCGRRMEREGSSSSGSSKGLFVGMCKTGRCGRDSKEETFRIGIVFSCFLIDLAYRRCRCREGQESG